MKKIISYCQQQQGQKNENEIISKREEDVQNQLTNLRKLINLKDLETKKNEDRRRNGKG